MGKIISTKSTDKRTEWSVNAAGDVSVPLHAEMFVTHDPLGHKWGYTATSTLRLLDLLLEHEAAIRAAAAREAPYLADVSAPRMDV